MTRSSIRLDTVAAVEGTTLIESPSSSRTSLVTIPQDKGLSRHHPEAATATVPSKKTPPSFQQSVPAVDSYPAIERIRNAQELEAFLQQDDRLVIVRFHASYCRSCKRLGRLLEQVALKFGDLLDDDDDSLVRQGKLRVGEVEYTPDTKDFCSSVGVDVFPTVHFYQQGKKLAGFGCGPAKFDILKKMLALFLKLQETVADKQLHHAAALRNQRFLRLLDRKTNPKLVAQLQEEAALREHRMHAFFAGRRGQRLEQKQDVLRKQLLAEGMLRKTKMDFFLRNVQK